VGDDLFDRLAAILAPYRETMDATTDEPGHLVLEWRGGTGAPADFFAMVRRGKRGVAFHLMPVYIHPDLLEGTSEALRKRMTGKSCFGFSRIDELVLGELAGLVARGAERVRQAG